MGEPRTVSKAAFGGLMVAFLTLFCAATYLADAGLSWAWGVRVMPRWGGIGLTYLFLAILAADWVFKRFGLSRSGKVVERRSRISLAADDAAPLGDFAEARMPWVLKTFILVVMPVMGVLLLASPLFDREVFGLLTWLAPGFGLLFLLTFATTLGHVMRDPRSPQARADADGVTGYSSRWPSRRIFVPWSDVLTCEIETNYNPFGTPMLLRPILRGHDGQTLLELNLSQTPMPEQEGIVKFIKARLPKVQVDPWEV